MPSTPAQAVVPLADRTTSHEAMLLGFMAHHSLPFTLAPEIVSLAKAFASDTKALNELSMDRSTASYKMRFGMGRTFHDELIEELRSNFFSLNIDEATSDNHRRVLSVMASYVSKAKDKVVVRHLASLEVIRVDAQTLLQALTNLFAENSIPWSNVMSILMDSCAVMRGSKSGLETKIRSELAPHLLDIDGDSCHHAHNAAKKFDNVFDQYLETLFSDIHADVKWSSDLKQLLAEICSLLDVKFTSPELYVATRWLSVYDVAVDTIRMLDALTIFYYGFLSSLDASHFLHACVEIYYRKQLSGNSKDAIREIHATLRKKNMTTEGKMRKERIIKKLFVNRKYTKILLDFYVSVLPLLKNYVLLFQKQEPQIHKLHDEQVTLLRQVFTCFIKPEALVKASGKDLALLNLKDHLQDRDDLFVGASAKKLMNDRFRGKNEFLAKVEAAYLALGTYLQKKMPVNNRLLRHVSALDPIVHGHTPALKYMKRLPELVTNVLKESELDMYELEVRAFHADDAVKSLESAPIDKWWVSVSKMDKYPHLSRMALAIVSCFHGPEVERNFSIMGNVITSQTASLSVKTFSAIQTVKFTQMASGKSPVEFFKRQDKLYDPVNPKLIHNMKRARHAYHEELKEVRAQAELKKAKHEQQHREVISKKAAKERSMEIAMKARLSHQKNIQMKMSKKKRK